MMALRTRRTVGAPEEKTRIKATRNLNPQKDAETPVGGIVTARDSMLRSGMVPAPRKVQAWSSSDLGVAGGDIAYGEPQLRNPLLSPSNFQLPQTSLELNQWIRYFDRFHPTVGNAVDMHSTVPFSRFALQGIPDPYIEQFYNDMADEMNLLRHIFEVAREYVLMGEAFPFLIWDDEMNCWGDSLVLNPDYIEVHGVMMGGSRGLRYELVIDHELRQFVMSNDPLDQEIIADLDPAIIQAAQSGLNAPLDTFNLGHLARRASPYDVRGSSILLGCVKDLLYDEQLREAMYAVAGGIIRPREIWKIGTQGEWMPSEGDLSDFRNMLSAMRNDPNAALVSHYGVTVENVDANRRVLPLKSEWDEIEKRLLTRLFTNKAATTGEGPTYSNASVAMTLLDARYASMRDMVVQHLRERVFLPVALANDFVDNDGNPIIPELRWLSRVNLKDRQQQVSYLMTLFQGGNLPFRSICDALDIDYDEALAWLKRERGTIVDPATSTAYKAMVTARVQAELQQDLMQQQQGGQEMAPEMAAEMSQTVDEVVEETESVVNRGIQESKGGESSAPTSDMRPPSNPDAPPVTARGNGHRPLADKFHRDIPLNGTVNRDLDRHLNRIGRRSGGSRVRIR